MGEAEEVDVGLGPVDVGCEVGYSCKEKRCCWGWVWMCEWHAELVEGGVPLIVASIEEWNSEGERVFVIFVFRLYEEEKTDC